MMTRVKLASLRRRELFDAAALHAVDVRALKREWDQLQDRYDHLPEFRKVIRRFITR